LESEKASSDPVPSERSLHRVHPARHWKLEGEKRKGIFQSKDALESRSRARPEKSQKNRGREGETT